MTVGFKEAVKELETVDDAFALINVFGTHYTSVVGMGAKCSMESEFTDTTYTKMIQQGNDFQASASCSFLKFTGSVLSSHDEHQAESFEGINYNNNFVQLCDSKSHCTS